MKKNTAAFVCGLIGAIFGLLGGILCSACTGLLAALEEGANAVSGASGNTTLPYLIVFIVLGIGGSVIALVGAIQALGYKKAAFPLCLVGLLLQVGTLICGFVGYGVAELYVGIGTIVAVVLLIVATVFSRRKQPTE
jgi:hypothetical protein